MANRESIRVARSKAMQEQACRELKDPVNHRNIGVELGDTMIHTCICHSHVLVTTFRKSNPLTLFTVCSGGG